MTPERFFRSIALNTLYVVTAFILATTTAGAISGDEPRGVTSLLYYLDHTNSLWAKDIQQMPDSAFREAYGSDLNLGFYPGTAWLVVTVNGLDPNGLTYLELKNPLLNEAECYAITPDGPEIISLTGDNLPFESRAFEHRNFIFPLKIESGEAKTLIIKTSTCGEQFLLPLRTWTREELEWRDDRDNIVRGSYYGLVAFVLLFNLFIFLMIREASSYWYLIYNFTLLILQLSLSGHAFQYLWPESPYLANVTNPVMASLSVFALLRFSQSFLNLPKVFPRLNSAFHWGGKILLLNAVLGALYVRPLFEVSVLTINGIALILNVVIIPTALLVYRRKFRPAKWFLLAFVVLVMTVFGFVLTNFGVIRSEFFADYGLLVGSAFEVILLSFAIVDRFKSFKDESLARLEEINRIQKESNEQLEVKVQERTEEIILQKQEIEYQKDEIISSIRYAKRIQQSLLPSSEQVRHALGDAFVLFLPKDIVSGDFYWVHRMADGRRVFALGDCTGHGVPGAFMGVLGYNFLEQLTSELVSLSPAQVLDQLDQRVKSALQGGPHGDNVSDGMDIVIGVIDDASGTLTYASANQKLIVHRKGELIELEGDRKAIGQASTGPFATHHFSLQRGDQLYAFTDGYKDQFGGERQKKLKISGFREQLARFAHLTMPDQSQALRDFFNHWKSGHEQVDDVCVVGVRI